MSSVTVVILINVFAQILADKWVVHVQRSTERLVGRLVNNLVDLLSDGALEEMQLNYTDLNGNTLARIANSMKQTSFAMAPSVIVSPCSSLHPKLGRARTTIDISGRAVGHGNVLPHNSPFDGRIILRSRVIRPNGTIETLDQTGSWQGISKWREQSGAPWEYGISEIVDEKFLLDGVEVPWENLSNMFPEQTHIDCLHEVEIEGPTNVFYDGEELPQTRRIRAAAYHDPMRKAFGLWPFNHEKEETIIQKISDPENQLPESCSDPKTAADAFDCGLKCAELGDARFALAFFTMAYSLPNLDVGTKLGLDYERACAHSALLEIAEGLQAVKDWFDTFTSSGREAKVLSSWFRRVGLRARETALAQPFQPSGNLLHIEYSFSFAAMVEVFMHDPHLQNLRGSFDYAPLIRYYRRKYYDANPHESVTGPWGPHQMHFEPL